MSVKKKLKLKRPIIIFFEIIIAILMILGVFFVYYQIQINNIVKIGYSKDASIKIYELKQTKFVEGIGYNKTVEKAFISKDFKEKNLKYYSNIDYHDQDHLISNINILVKKGYSIKEINLIFDHGSDEDVSYFTGLDKQRYVEDFLRFDFSYLNRFERYVKYSMESGEKDEDCVVYINLDLDKEVYAEPNIVSKFDYNILVNKHYKLSDDFKVDNLVNIPAKYASSNDQKLNETVLNAFIKMYEKADSDGQSLIINSAYRSHSDQEELYNTYLRLYGEDYAFNYVAKSGHSEHETGLCFDIGSRNSNIFAKSSEYEWMQQNAYKYGFILRFPEWGTDLTQFRSESWHYRYVGVDVATYLHDNIMTYEEYYVRFLQNK